MTADVCIIGGGPAGAALAIRLARLGHACVIVERSNASAHTGRGESLVPGALPLLDVLGVSGPVEVAGYLRPSRTLVAWSGAPEWSARFPRPGFQVDRADFDRRLLDAARRAGAVVLQPARVLRAERGDGLWHVSLRMPNQSSAVSCRILADAAGRAGWLPGRKTRTAPKTLALYASWDGVALDGPETRVEAGDREWFWGAPLSGGRFNTAVFVDPDVCRAAGRTAGGLRALHDRLLSRSTLLASCLRGRPTSGVTVCDATPCHDDEPATADTIKVGDSALSLDPLSSQGLASALGSALHAAAVVHTILDRPHDAALAVEFYRRARAAASAFHARTTPRMYREAGSRASAFWQRRAASCDGPLPDRHPTHGAAVLRGDYIVSGVYDPPRQQRIEVHEEIVDGRGTGLRQVLGS